MTLTHAARVAIETAKIIILTCLMVFFTRDLAKLIGLAKSIYNTNLSCLTNR